jgi:hypothetical protein
MMDEIRMAADYEKVALWDATVKLKRNTKYVLIAWAIGLISFIYAGWDLTPLWILLLGIYLNHERIADLHRNEYNFQLTKFMFNVLKNKIDEKNSKSKDA